MCCDKYSPVSDSKRSSPKAPCVVVWRELCSVRHSRDVAGPHGKQPLIDSLCAGGKDHK
jgi:hypothetical protein